MKIVIIKYNAGNIQSVSYAMERLNIDFEVTSDPVKIQSADKVIFPGVGEANTTMKYLKEHQLDQVIVNLKQPVLGICLGMQLLCSHSEENDTPCLGVFEEQVKKFQPTDDMKVPHMGWNSLESASDWLRPDLNGQFAYFVHSYYVPLCQWTSAQTQYTVPFSSAIRKNNFYAVQFHPEKSAAAGTSVLQSFLSL